MPFTPYHFGPAGFLGLVFKKRIDIPAFVLANVAVDIEPLALMIFRVSGNHHRFFHTLIGATLAGIALAIALFPPRKIIAELMNLLHLPYETTFLKITIWAVLGGWFHVFIDSICHWDVRPFWPSRIRPLYWLVNYDQLKYICLGFWLAAIILLLCAYIGEIIGKAKSLTEQGAVDK